MNIYKSLINLAKSIKYQNLFFAAKELHNVKLFQNDYDFSKLQNFFLSWLYTVDSLNKEIITDNISQKVLEDEIYADAYLAWRKKNKFKKEESKDKKRGLSLVAGKKLKFRPKEVK